MDIVSISISTTLELPTLENGAIRIVYPTLLTPIVTGQMTTSKSENGSKSEENGCVLNSAASPLSEVKRILNATNLLLRPTSCFGATSGKQDRALDSERLCVRSIFTSPAVNLAPYELNFQLLVRGACLLAGTAIFSLSLSRNILILLLIPSKLPSGLESPTHALRADADPSAQSASATYITLAQEHPYDRHIEIILHLSGEQSGTFSSLISANLI